MAMEDGAAPVSEPCPILRAWSKSPTIMGQVAKARRMLILQHDKLNRATLVDNMEVLAPVINHLGTLA